MKTRPELILAFMLALCHNKLAIEKVKDEDDSGDEQVAIHVYHRAKSLADKFMEWHE